MGLLAEVRYLLGVSSQAAAGVAAQNCHEFSNIPYLSHNFAYLL